MLRCSCWCSRRARVLVYFRVPPASRARPQELRNGGPLVGGTGARARLPDFSGTAVCTT